MPDSDENGQRYRDRIVTSLSRAEIEFKVIEFPGCKDIRDFIGHLMTSPARRISGINDFSLA
jgi:hypothetical protein